MQSFDSKNTDATDVADSRDATDAAVAVPVPFAIAVLGCGVRFFLARATNFKIPSSELCAGSKCDGGL